MKWQPLLHLPEGYFSHITGSTSNWGSSTQAQVFGNGSGAALRGRRWEGSKEMGTECGHKATLPLFISPQLLSWCQNVDSGVFCAAEHLCWPGSPENPLCSSAEFSLFIRPGYFPLCFLIPLLPREKRKGEKVDHWRCTILMSLLFFTLASSVQYL